MIFNFLLALLVATSVGRQAPLCMVKIANISASYEGQCKNGLAHGTGKATGVDTYLGIFRQGLPHGEGKYTWENNDYYLGSFKNGEKHGYGTLYIAIKDSLFTGIWKKNVFIRQARLPQDKKAYTIFYQRNTTRVVFTKISEARRIFYKVGESGGKRNISVLSNYGTSGYYMEYPNMFGFEEAVFPFQGKLTFLAPSRTGFVQLQIELFFEIREPGYWEVTVHF